MEKTWRNVKPLTRLLVQKRHQYECASSGLHQQHIPLQSKHALWSGNMQRGSPKKDV